MKFKDLNQDVKEFIASDDTILKLFDGNTEKVKEFAQLTGDIATKTGEDRQEAIKKFIKELNDSYYKGKIVTEVAELTRFYQAEDYHQNFEK